MGKCHVDEVAYSRLLWMDNKFGIIWVVDRDDRPLTTYFVTASSSGNLISEPRPINIWVTKETSCHWSGKNVCIVNGGAVNLYHAIGVAQLIVLSPDGQLLSDDTAAIDSPQIPHYYGLGLIPMKNRNKFIALFSGRYYPLGESSTPAKKSSSGRTDYFVSPVKISGNKTNFSKFSNVTASQKIPHWENPSGVLIGKDRYILGLWENVEDDRDKGIVFVGVNKKGQIVGKPLTCEEGPMEEAPLRYAVAGQKVGVLWYASDNYLYFNIIEP